MKSCFNLKRKTCYLIATIYLFLNLFLFIFYTDPEIIPIELDYGFGKYPTIFRFNSWIGLFIILLSNFYIFIFEIQKAILVGIIGNVFHIIIIINIAVSLDF